jgi:hypothetical protein
MGVMESILRGVGLGRGDRCFKMGCGEVVVLSRIRMPIVTANIEQWSSPLPGYCKRCHVFVCSAHAVFIKENEFTYLSGCPKCQGELQT